MSALTMLPILLLHGQPGSSSDWDGVVRALGPGAPVIAIDRPGWDGRSRATDLAGNAAAAVAALDEHGAARATVAGHSFGAAVAAWLGVHHPDRVASLVLAAPAANTDSLHTLDRLLAAPLIGYVASAAALSLGGAALATGPLRRRVASGFSVDDRYLRAAAGRLLSPRAWRSFVLEQRTLIADLPALESTLGRIAVHTTILTGANDGIVPASSVHRLLDQIPNARLTVIERAGHLLPLGQPREVAAAIGAAAGAYVSGPGSGTAGVGGSCG